MKRILLSVLSLIFIITAQAQNLSISPVPSVGEDPDNTGTGTAHATLQNNGSETKEDITWVRTTNDLSPEWKSSICDFTYCYSPTTDIAPSPLVLIPGGSGEVKVNFSTYDYAGSGYVEIKYYSVSDSANYNALGVFTYESDGVGFHSPSNDNTYALYPNPAVSDINLIASTNAKIASVQFVNIVGKVISSANWITTSGKMTLSVNNIPEGIYFVQFMNANHDVVATRKLAVKH